MTCAAIHVLEGGLRQNLSDRGHVAVPQTAELGAADLERAGLQRLDVGDVVGARDRIRLDPESVGPEAVDDIERGDMDLDPLADG